MLIFKFFIKYVYLTIFIILILFWMLFFSELFNSIISKTKEIQRESSVFEMKKKELQKLSSLINQLEAIKSNLKDILEILPREPNVKEYYLEAEAILNRIGTVIGTLTVVDNKKGKISINMSFTTSYQNFKEFLRLIEKEKRITDITKINFSSSRITEVKSQNIVSRGYTFSINAESYYLK